MSGLYRSDSSGCRSPSQPLNNSQVYKAIRRGTTEVAIKKLNCKVDEVLLHQMQQEIAIMRKVNYDQNIVQFYGACLSDPAMLCMEYMKVREPNLLKPGPRRFILGL